MKLNMKSFLQSGTPDSMMRLLANKSVSTACFIAVAAPVAMFIALMTRILQGKEIESLIGVISAFLGGIAAILGTLLVSAFGGKVGQKFAENQGGQNDQTGKTTDDNQGHSGQN